MNVMSVFPSNMCQVALPVILGLILVSCGQLNRNETASSAGAFEESWESLSRVNEEPEWFRDAKFGIYFHWGVYSVPAYSTE